MNILAIDTSGLVSGAAVIAETKIMGEFYTNFKKTHSQTLLPIIEQLLKTLDMEVSDIDYVACASGPGSFTGLRIGAAAAKAIAQGAGKPIVPVPTLDALAYNVFDNKCVIAPVMDARRGQVYTAFYKNTSDGPVRLSEYMAEDIGYVLKLLSEFDEDKIFLGDGVDSCMEMISGSCINFLLAPPGMNTQRAASVGCLAASMVKEGKFVNYNDFAPFYIRKSQAEREYEEKHGNG